MPYPSGITDKELLKELGHEIMFQRRMIRSIHLLDRETPQDRRDRLQNILDDYSSALCVAYELLTGVRFTW